MEPDPGTPVEELANIGRVTAGWLREVDIATYGDLAAVGAVEAYARLRFRHGRQVTRNALHGLEAAIRGIDWRALDAPTRAALDVAAAARLRAIR